MKNSNNKITLIRHAKPRAHEEYSSFAFISGKDIEQFIKAWNTCELHNENNIPSSLKEIIADGDLFISSGLKRTHESLQMLGINEFEKNNLFNEAEIPYGIGKKIKMPLIIWLVALRLLWRFGLHRNSESYRDFIKRIRRGADFIEENRDVNHIIVMAHGFVNRIMKRELEKRGWKILTCKGGHGYWSYATLGKG